MSAPRAGCAARRPGGGGGGDSAGQDVPMVVRVSDISGSDDLPQDGDFTIPLPVDASAPPEPPSDSE